ncbi:MAG: DUF2069 domain-containing protein [Thiobacillus sp.]|nr:DUF2069 domain-containing protein [Thiobacillus sp.]
MSAPTGDPRSAISEQANAAEADLVKTFLLQHIASASLIALIFLCVSWELWLAPLRPGGSSLVFKALPLLFPLMGILKGRRYTYQWAPMLVLAYFTEGVVRAWSDTGLSAWLAGGEVVLSMVFFFAAIYYAKFSAPSRQA